jgi:hypothetical protein
MEVFKRGTGFGLSSAERHLARDKRSISHEMPPGITGKMPVPRCFATRAILQIQFGDVLFDLSGRLAQRLEFGAG